MSGALRHEHVGKLLNQLAPRQKKILGLRFGLNKKEPLTLEAVAKHFKITKERVRQIEKKAIGKLKDLIIEEGIKEGIEEDEVLG